MSPKQLLNLNGDTLKKRNRLPAVSLFSNCGAGDVGFRSAGFDFIVMAELEAKRLEVCGYNHPNAALIVGDLRETWNDVVNTYRARSGESPSLLSACPPCQGMSSARGSRGKERDAEAGMKDTRNLLVQVICDVAKELKPKLVVVENVPAFLTRLVRHPKTNEPVSAASILINALERDYAVYPVLLDLCDYGVPQTRKRTFITLLRRDLSILDELDASGSYPYPKPTHTLKDGGPITLKQALDSFGLPKLDASTPELAKSKHKMHFVPIWDDRRYAMTSAIPANSGRSAWDNSDCIYCGLSNLDGTATVCTQCGQPLPRPLVKLPNGSYKFIKGFRSSSYKRMHPDEPAPTITTATGHIGSHTTLHPSENRVLSPLECALLQTFPKSFKWKDALDKWGHTNIRQMIGEAVPPLFTSQHGKLLSKLLLGVLPRNLLKSEDLRCTQARERLESTKQLYFLDFFPSI